jgi:GTP-binding protein HflX
VDKTEIPIGQDVVAMSAKQGFGMEQLLKAIEGALDNGRHHIVVTLPYSMGGMVDKLHSGAQVLGVDYTGDGIVVETIVDPILYGRLKDYITKEC